MKKKMRLFVAGLMLVSAGLIGSTSNVIKLVVVMRYMYRKD